jgi:hypothetical protein
MESDLSPISQEKWNRIEELGTFLNPFAAVTKYMSGSTYPTVAGVVPIFNRLCDHLEDSIAKYTADEVCK